VAEQLWLMTCIREEEEESVLQKTKQHSRKIVGDRKSTDKRAEDEETNMSNIKIQG